jgi:(p)ppGpp synthase/HD superfamily hydrolase
MNSLGEAIKIAARVHDGQLDKAGEDYILHPLAVMRMVAPDRKAMIVAVLHDTIEDLQVAVGVVSRVDFIDELRRRFSFDVMRALLALTKKPNEPYYTYIERIAENSLAKKVKIADLTHNMDPRRIPATQIVDKDYKRWEKYRRALIRLERD